MPDDPQPADDESPSTPVETPEPAQTSTEPPQTSTEPPLPTPEELTAAPDATIRHAPKFGAFITAGALTGMVVALLLTVLIGPAVPLASDGSGFLPFLDGENAVRTIMVVTGAVVGGFAGALLAVLADRRSVRRTGRSDG
ncbi:histidine kinase [Cellulomonas sp. McL0617]|uniref:histidine kinase n=1 Tax=Cellulomonas sp. McL0617 TaxID=3415675 RepID=UPI003CF48817